MADYARFERRVAASLIDQGIMMVLTLVLQLSSAPLLGFLKDMGLSDATFTFLTSSFAGFLTSWSYYATFESSRSQATPGKMALGILVTDLQGRRISFERATARYFGHMLSAFTLGIGYLMVLWTEKRQALHDRLAGTLVCKKGEAR